MCLRLEKKTNVGGQRCRYSKLHSTRSSFNVDTYLELLLTISRKKLANHQWGNRNRRAWHLNTHSRRSWSRILQKVFLIMFQRFVKKEDRSSRIFITYNKAQRQLKKPQEKERKASSETEKRWSSNDRRAGGKKKLARRGKDKKSPSSQELKRLDR